MKRIVALAMITTLVACAGDRSSRLVDSAEQFLRDGDLESAFVILSELDALDPTAAADAGIEETAETLTASPASLRVDVIVALARHLTARMEYGRLAELLDASMAEIPAGEGPMGSDIGRPNESPRHDVVLPSFFIDRFEVTNAQYERFVIATARTPPVAWTEMAFPDGTADHPVLGVDWDDADAYCRWSGKRLPTEAEWERACRTLDGRVFPWGDDWEGDLVSIGVLPLRDPDEAWRWVIEPEDGFPTPTPIASHTDAGGIYGVFDLQGNAAEWVEDWYDPAAYRLLPSSDPVSAEPPWQHVVRGCAWIHPHEADMGDVAESCRCARRNASHSGSDPRLGFRCAADL